MTTEIYTNSRNEFVQFIESVRFPKPTYDFYTIALFVILDYALVDESGKICLYLDEFMRMKLENIFHCSKSCVKRYITQLTKIGKNGLLSHSDLTTYHLNNELASLIKNMQFSFTSHKLDTRLPQYCNKMKAMIVSANLSERTLRLLNILYNNMVLFESNSFYDKFAKYLMHDKYNMCAKKRINRQRKLMQASKIAKDENEFFSILRDKGIKKMPSILTNEELNTDKTKRENIKNLYCKYFVFITPDIRQRIIEETGYKGTYFHEDLTCLCKKGFLIKTSAYRFFLNPDCTDITVDEIMYPESEFDPIEEIDKQTQKLFDSLQ